MTGNCLVRFWGGETSLKNVDLSQPFIIGGLLSVILLMQTIFSGNLTLFFRKSDNKPWNKDQTLSFNYPWFQTPPVVSPQEKREGETQKNNIKMGWSSPSSLSYVNNEIGSKDTFLKKIQNQMYVPEKSEQVFQPFLLNALNKNGIDVLEDTLKHENLKSNEMTDTLWQQNVKSHGGFPSFASVLEGPSKMQKKNFYIILDNLSYRMMGIGFPLFTLGILSGAVWANEAWGSYWSWDIKEVGSFINWLLVALYFHCRYKNFISLSHIVAFISLMVLFFNFFGISLGIFGSSLHAYGASS